MPETKNPKAATPAVPAKKAAAADPLTVMSKKKAHQNTEYDVPEADKPKPTEADKAAKKASEDSAKVEADAAEKAGKINARLIKSGDPRRVYGGVRGGKPVFYWGNFVPTMAMTEEDQKAAEAM